MKNPILTLASIVCGAVLTLAASSAMAHVDVGIHIGIPGVIVPPVPVYVEPRPVYVEPAYPQPVYAEPVYEQRVYVRPHPVFVIEGERRYWRERRHYWHDGDFHEHREHWERHGYHDGR